MQDLEQSWICYNDLPHLSEASDRFENRDVVFANLARLLASYGHEFGVCLVHTHCTLTRGEIMLEHGNISQPVQATDAGICYAERWLPSGQPYEFTTRPSRTPPSALINEFRELTKASGVLGLYFAGDPGSDEERLEWTDGRKNKVRPIREEDAMYAPVETAWNLGKQYPATMKCVLQCARDTTASGGGHLGKGKKEHVETT